MDSRARKELQHTIELLSQSVGADDPRTALAEVRLSVELRNDGDLVGARQIGKRAAKARDVAWQGRAAHPRGGDPARLDSARLRKAGEAARLLHEVHSRNVRAHGERSPVAAVSLANVALAERASGNLDAARSDQEAAVAILKATLGTAHPMTLSAESNLAAVVGAGGDSEAAERVLWGVFETQRAELSLSICRHSRRSRTWRASIEQGGTSRPEPPRSTWSRCQEIGSVRATA